LISEAPTTAARDQLGFEDKLGAFLAIARLKAYGGITVAEFGELLIAAMRMAIAAVDALPSDGAAKKAMVIAAVGVVFDSLADYAVPALAYPFWIVARPAVRSLVLMFAAGAIESLLPLVRLAK
jgi:hypothetical protein